MNKPDQIKIKYQEPVGLYIRTIGGSISLMNQPKAVNVIVEMNSVNNITWYIIGECKFRNTVYKILTNPRISYKAHEH